MIVFVCSGNIIRSAFCELYAKHLGISCSSFGTRYRNTRIHPQARKALLARGVPHRQIKEFTPRFISEVKYSSKNKYYCMTKEHVSDLLQAGFEEERVFLLASVLGEESDIQDPFFTGEFTKVFDVLEKCVHALKQNL